MSSQRLRVVAAFTLAVLTTLIIGTLAITSRTVPSELNYLAVAAYMFLFGVTTNGSSKPLG